MSLDRKTAVQMVRSTADSKEHPMAENLAATRGDSTAESTVQSKVAKKANLKAVHLVDSMDANWAALSGFLRAEWTVSQLAVQTASGKAARRVCLTADWRGFRSVEPKGAQLVVTMAAHLAVQLAFPKAVGRV